MSPISDLILKALPDHGLYELEEDLVYQGNRDAWTIPAGFVTDLASVPRLLWPLFPPFGRHSKAAVVHDWLYVERPLARTKSRISEGRVRRRMWRIRPITRAQADGVFRRIMRELGVSWWRRYLMWAGVRLGGWYVWRKRHG